MINIRKTNIHFDNRRSIVALTKSKDVFYETKDRLSRSLARYKLYETLRSERVLHFLIITAMLELLSSY